MKRRVPARVDFCVGFFAALLGALVPVGAVHALNVTFETGIGEVVEGHPIVTRIISTQPGRSSCRRSAMSREGNVFHLAVRSGGSFCSIEFDLGKLDVGTYEVRATFEGPSGAVVEQTSVELRVLPLEGRCNAQPGLTPQIYGVTAPDASAARAQAIAADVELARRFPGTSASSTGIGVVEIHLAPLQDLPPVMAYLDSAYAWRDIWDPVPGRVYRQARPYCDAAGRDALASFVEFEHGETGSFFYTSSAEEIDAIDAGARGHWRRTGQQFVAVSRAACPVETGQAAVYRFWGGPGDQRAHFFTRDREECHAVDASRRFTYESAPFRASAPRQDGTCDAAFDGSAQVPLRRAWRPVGAPVHRLVGSAATMAEMVERGWVDEGPVMCVRAGPPP